MWHVSIAPIILTLSPDTLAEIALSEINGLGDASRGEWRDWTGRAYHVRRRLSASEQVRVGPALDIRGSPEARKRLNKVRALLPAGWSE